MASIKKPQQVSVEDLERRFTQLSVKASQVDPRYKVNSTSNDQFHTLLRVANIMEAPTKESRGAGIFEKSPKACERDFMKELERLEDLSAKSQQSKKTSAETQKKLNEFEAFMNSL
ncbi:hypothetical protein PG995_012047 [Apiospora arundinis]